MSRGEYFHTHRAVRDVAIILLGLALIVHVLGGHP
jgi:hypothetical protein